MIKISAYITSNIFGDFYSFNVKIILTTLKFLNNFIFTSSGEVYSCIFINILTKKYMVVVKIATCFRIAKNLLNMVVVYYLPSEKYIRKDLFQTFFTFHYLGPLYVWKK
tara:strand:+ start:518 stop:844 length:327 start_codon:yes stop_codon:yes gene_type:complete